MTALYKIMILFNITCWWFNADVTTHLESLQIKVLIYSLRKKLCIYVSFCW